MKLSPILSLVFLLPLFGCITGAAVTTGDRVTIEYTATVLNHTFDKGATSFIVGKHEVIPGVEAGVIGMKIGEEKTFTVPPALAYGEYNESFLIRIDTRLFNGTRPHLYDKVTLFGRQGMVVNESDEAIIVDLNHWLAGQEITFHVKVLNIEKP